MGAIDRREPFLLERFGADQRVWGFPRSRFRSVAAASRTLSSIFAADAINRGRNRSQPLSRNFLPALKAIPFRPSSVSRQGAGDLRQLLLGALDDARVDLPINQRLGQLHRICGSRQRFQIRPAPDAFTRS